MTTKTLTAGPTKNALLNSYIEKLKDAGFKVIVPESKSTYAFFEKDENIGYVEVGRFTDRLRFGTQHRPNRTTGTGYGLQAPYEGTTVPTIQDALDTFVIAPDWAHREDLPSIVKYKSLKEYLGRNTVVKYCEV